MTTTPPLPERISDFEIVSKLGSGGMGVVYLARQVDTGEEVALKVMHIEQATQDVLRRRFVREARATMALDHPNIIRIRGSFMFDTAPVIAMEVLRGLSLKEYLAQEGKLSVEETAGIFVCVVSAVGAAHAIGLVHRDLKPDNIFLLSESPFVKVLDFGIAKLSKDGALAETSVLTKTGTMIGTPYYMSPEQAFGEKGIDHRSDIWSLGIILYETLTGTLLTRAPVLEEVFAKLITGVFPRLDAVDPSIPAELADLVFRMLQRNPDHRPEDLREVFATLTRLAPDVALEASVFEAAAVPLAFDDPSTTTGSGQKKAIAAEPATSATPIKLAPPLISKTRSPHSVKSTERREASAEPFPVAAAATVILEGGQARPPAGEPSRGTSAELPTGSSAPSPGTPASSGTVIIEAPTAPASPAAKRALTTDARTAPDSPAAKRTLSATVAESSESLAKTVAGSERRSSAWIWWVSAVLIVGCLVVLWTQLR